MSKIGAHVTKHPRHNYEALCRAKPAAVLGLNDGGALAEAKEWSDGFTLTVFRDTTIYLEAPSDVNDPPGSYEQMAGYWYPQLKAKWNQNPADYYTITNEQGGNDPQSYRNLIAYEREIMKLANADGIKVCVLNLAGGCPGDFQMWVDICVPFIREAFDAGNIYGRHGYENNWDRVLNEAQYLEDNDLDGGLLVTEWGFNGGYGQIHDTATIRMFDEWTWAFPNIIGFCIWELGDSEFHANWDHLIPELTPWMLANPTEKWIPGDPTTPPAGKHKAIAFKVPQEYSLEQWTAAAQMAYELRHSMTASHDDAITILQGGNEASFAKIVDPSHYSQWETIAYLEGLNLNWEAVYIFDTPPGPEPEILLPVEPLSQRDLRWANVTLGQDSGHGKTIGNWGCLLVAYNMMAQYTGLTHDLPDQYNAHMVGVGAFSDQFLLPGALQMAHPDRVTYHGVLTRDDSQMKDRIREYIGKDTPVPVRVDFRPSTEAWEQHWVLIIGYRGAEFIMADPWTGRIGEVSATYDIEGDDILKALFYTVAGLPSPGTFDMLSFMKADPTAWRVIRHSSGAQEDFRDMELGGGAWAMVKNSLAEFWYTDGQYIYLKEDTSPDNCPSHGHERCYKVNPGRWCLAHMQGGVTFRDGGHTVQFYHKDDCSQCSDNSGESSNTTTVTKLERDYTFNEHGQNLTLDEVLFVQGNTETQIFARHDGKAVGRVGWIAPWGNSEIVELHWDRGVLTDRPDGCC